MNKQELIEKFKNLLKRGYILINMYDVLDLVKQLDKPEKVKVPQYIADKIKYCKESDGYGLFHAMDYCFNFKKCASWLDSYNNQETFARAWLDGYEVEKEKRYTVKVKGIGKERCYLKHDNEWHFGSAFAGGNLKTIHHTRKELEEAGFGWVFDCPGIEIEEVEDDTKI